jgi:chromosomal replication initiator protein
MFYCLTYQCDLPSKEISKTIKKPEPIGKIDTLDLILNSSIYFRISLAKITGPKRNRDIVDARHMIMYYLRNYSKLSLTQIGKQFSNRDHTSVIHAINTVERIRSVDEFYNNQYILFESYLNKINTSK